MLQVLYAVKDTKLSEFLPPFVSPDEKSCLVRIQRAVKSGNVEFAVDFELWELGDYETNTGRIMPLDSPKFICNLSRYLP